MANVKATDLINFARLSKGYALAKVSYGSELVTNGDFELGDNGDWTNSDFTISGGQASTSSGTIGYVDQSISFVSGKVYELSVDIVSISGGSASIQARGVSTIASTIGTDAGGTTHKFIYADTVNNTTLRVFAGSGTNLTIDNVSVKEVTFDQPDGTLQLFEHPNNIPRIEYDADGNLLGLLIEEARTNLVAYSENFNGSGWVALNNGTGTSPIITAAYAQSPDGTQTATRLQASISGDEGTDDFSLIQFAFGLRTGDFTNSIWIKSNTGEDQKVYFRIQGNNEVTATQEWTRVSVTDNYPSAASLVMSVGIRNSLGSENLDILIWGAQGEAGSFPTSYIKTSGSTASRSADLATIDVDQFGYNQSEGTLFVELQHFDPRTGSKIATGAGFGDGTTNNRMWYYQNKGQWIGASGGVSQFSITGSEPSENTPTKFAGAFKTNDFTAYIDGTSIGADSSGSVPTVPTLFIGYSGTNNSELNGHIKSINYYPKRLSNAKLQELTS